MKIQRTIRRTTLLYKSFMREPLTSVKIPSLKRKKISPSLPNPNPLTSIYTRSKSRIFSHRNRSGVSRPDPIRRICRKPTPKMEQVEAFLGANSRNASRLLLTKDIRHKRIFSEGVNSVIEELYEEKNEERNKLFQGFDSSTVPGVDRVKEYELKKSEVGDERISGDNDLKLNDQAIPGNGSSPKSALNGCHRKKVFKTPSSFSYRRLLPHLMDIVNDSSSASKIELVDAGSPSKIPKLNGDNFEARSVDESSYAVKTECVFKTQFNGSKKVHMDVSTIEPDLSAPVNELERTAETMRPLEVKEKGHENDISSDVASEEENIQTTPPDPGMLAKTEFVHSRVSVDVKRVHGENETVTGLPVVTEKSSSEASRQSPNARCSTNSMNETVLNPCSRLRLFKNPRSFSYRRLLPFLMDISKSDSCTSRKPQQKTPQVVSEVDRHPAPDANVEHDKEKNIAIVNSLEKTYSEDLIHTASDSSSPSTNTDPRSVNSVTLPDLSMLMEETPQCQSDLGSKGTTSVSEHLSFVSYVQTKQCTSGEPRSVEKQDMCLSTRLEVDNSNIDSVEVINMKQQSVQIRTSDALVSPTIKSLKGVLKRNRRGCRGLCTCLNCASFRLHAERAFEFSRIQLHDAEEVASELMKELANLRLLLEKSITEKDGSASTQPNPVLIKQACKKALEAESLAKERLGELNNDLSAHCRIPNLLEPKVTFAYNNQ